MTRRIFAREPFGRHWEGFHDATNIADDWHVRWQLAPTEGRDAQGRLTLAMNQTLVVLRPDAQAGFVGLAYDAR